MMNYKKFVGILVILALIGTGINYFFAVNMTQKDIVKIEACQAYEARMWLGKLKTVVSIKEREKTEKYEELGIIEIEGRNGPITVRVVGLFFYASATGINLSCTEGGFIHMGVMLRGGSAIGNCPFFLMQTDL